jgi:glycosyltransferase involved in cell wall biosynthesis
MSTLGIFFHAKAPTREWLSNVHAWTRQCPGEIEFCCLVPETMQQALSSDVKDALPGLTIFSVESENLGQTFSQACSQSKSDWLLFWDTRLPLRCQSLPLLLSSLKRSKHDIAFAVVQRLSRQVQKWKQLPHVDPTEDIPLVFSRKALLELGGFNTVCRFRPLYDLVLRATRAGHRWKRLNLELAGSVAPLNRSRESLEEALRISQAHYGRVSFRWALRYGRAAASFAGKKRWSSNDYHGYVLRNAEAFYDGTDAWSTAGLRLLHTLTESKAILNSPKPTANPLRSRIIRWPDYFSSRIFQLGYHEAIPCRLPVNYVSSRRPTSPWSPTIAITTPNLNQGSTIERTILSVLGQGYPNLEYTIQDGGSQDQSLAVMRRYEDRLTRCASQPDRGQAEAIIRGFERTTGEIMAYLNSDDVLLPGALEFVGNYFAKNPHVDVVYGDRVLIDDNDREINRWYLPAYDPETIQWADYIPQETMFWRRRAWDAVGGIDTSFQFAMDWDLILRFRRAGIRFEHVPRLLGAFRISDNQKTSALIATSGFREMSRLRERELGFIPTQEEVTARVNGYVRKHRRVSGWRLLQRHWTATADWTASVAKTESIEIRAPDIASDLQIFADHLKSV